MSIRALVVDDELPARIRLTELLEKISGVEILNACHDGSEAVRQIALQRPDLVFLDIQMPNMDGFEVVRQITTENMPVTVFVTAYDAYAIQAFEASAVDYLLKPFSDHRFEEAFRRAEKYIRGQKASDLNIRLKEFLASTVELPSETGYLERIALKSAGRVRLLDTSSVDWIEGAGVYVVFHAGNKTYEHRLTVGQLEQRLNPKQFLRIHRSTIVNLERVQELQARTHGDYILLLRDGTELMLSRAYRPQLEAWLKQPF